MACSGTALPFFMNQTNEIYGQPTVRGISKQSLQSEKTDYREGFAAFEFCMERSLQFHNMPP
jgi:hypothetical protein